MWLNETYLLSSNNKNNQLSSKLNCSILNVHRSCVFLVEMYVTREPSHKLAYVCASSKYNNIY